MHKSNHIIKCVNETFRGLTTFLESCTKVYKSQHLVHILGNTLQYWLVNIAQKQLAVCQFRGIPQYHEFHITIYHEYATFTVLLMSIVLTADLRSLRVTDSVTEYRMLIH